MTATFAHDSRFTDAVWVLVSTELLAELGEWSEPVQAQIIDSGPGYSPRFVLTFRTVEDKESS